MSMSALSIAVLTCSDTRTLEEDTAGAALEEECRSLGWEFHSRDVVRDSAEAISVAIKRLADKGGVDVVLTCGGTGLGPRDVTPDVTAEVCNYMVPGIPEAMRALSLEVTHRAMLSRAACGVRGTTLVVNLPGSKKGATECFGFIADQLEHARDMIAGGGH